jgi:hypothetical protein
MKTLINKDLKDVGMEFFRTIEEVEYYIRIDIRDGKLYLVQIKKA